MRARGFTLIEIMVVILIIGLVSTYVVLKIGGNNRDTHLDQEAERLDALFDYVREQAELQTRDYGLRFSETGYTFVVFDVLGNQWRPVDEDDALRERDLPGDIQPHVVVEGRTIVLDKKKKDTDADDFAPQVMIFANGDLSSFELELRREDSNLRARLYTDEDSNVQMVLPGQPEPQGPPLHGMTATAVKK
jgi:general secretion pathway protein H